MAKIVVYKDLKPSFPELLIEGNILYIQYKNLQKLVTQTFNVKNDLLPELRNDIFEFIKKSCSLRTNLHFRSKSIRTTKNGIKTLFYYGPKLWYFVPNKYKSMPSLSDFKAKIKI